MRHSTKQDFEMILESITDGFFILDRSWRFSYMNSAFERMYHFRRELYIGREYWEVFPKSMERSFGPQFHKAVKEQMSVHFEEFSPTLQKWLSVKAYPFHDGLAIYYRDISEEKKAREKIKADEHNMRLLINNTDDPIWAIDVSANIILCNNAFSKWIAHFIGTELHKGDNVLSSEFGRAYMDKFETCYKMALAGKTFRAVEDVIIDGERKFTAIRFHPVYDSNEVMIGVSCFARDITEQREYLDKIEAQNKTLLEIAAIESHKVRGPIANILGLLQLLNNDDITDPINKQVIEGITTVTEGLDEIITDIVRKSNSISNRLGIDN
ncbi:MAG: PAS domain-containing protein [Bacteroidota bacterium]